MCLFEALVVGIVVSQGQGEGNVDNLSSFAIPDIYVLPILLWHLLNNPVCLVHSLSPTSRIFCDSLGYGFPFSP